MPTDVLRVSGDYRIAANNNGNIIFDVTGPTTGTVRILGNLDVIGQTSQIESVNSLINDNIIVLNAGEINPYVTLGTSGIAIDRGSNSDLTNAATMYYNDGYNGNNGWTNSSGTSFRGVWQFSAASTGSAIAVSAIRSNSTLQEINFLGAENQFGILSVKGTSHYERQVIDPDHIPNKAYVDNRLYTGTTFAKKLQVGNSFIQINDPSVPSNDQFYGPISSITAALGSATNIVFQLSGNSAIIQGIAVNNNVISLSTFSNTVTNLILQPPTNSSVLVLSLIHI